jgi:hypothetical protein
MHGDRFLPETNTISMDFMNKQDLMKYKINTIKSVDKN